MAPAAEDVKAAIRARVERKALSAPRKVLKLSDAQLEPARRHGSPLCAPRPPAAPTATLAQKT